MLVWSFHSQAWAARLLRKAGFMASGMPWASTGSGVEPVVSTPTPTTSSTAKSGSRRAMATASSTDLEEAVDVVGGVLPGEIGVFRIEQDARLAARIGEDRGGDLAAVGRIDDQRPHAIGPIIDADGESPLLSHESDPPR